MKLLTTLEPTGDASLYVPGLSREQRILADGNLFEWFQSAPDLMTTVSNRVSALTGLKESGLTFGQATVNLRPFTNTGTIDLVTAPAESSAVPTMNFVQASAHRLDGSGSDPIDDDLTVAMLITATNSGAGMTMLGHYTDATHQFVIRRGANGTYLFDCGNSSAVVAAQANFTWLLLAVSKTVAGTTRIRVCADGGSPVTATASGTGDVGSGTLTLGARQTATNPFDGQMAHLAFWTGEHLASFSAGPVALFLEHMNALHGLALS